ncbi:3-deoxy-D-manno-octulosonic acid kinase [Rhodobacteraceae bacterium]|nr:3-deoxy-D-manno-octulosonic acid kinase [Paracoccaceae bacterium]
MVFNARHINLVVRLAGTYTLVHTTDGFEGLEHKRMGTTAELRQNGLVILYDNSILNVMEPQLFDAAWLRANGYHDGTSRGRNQAHFLSYANHEMVLRKFMRGGLIAKINPDLFVRTGKDRNRAMREFKLLDWMNSNGLPVPRPVAARFTTLGPFYRAAIITERIPGARPLEDILREMPVSSTIWFAIGAAVKQLHNHHVFHSDLNCRNILIDAESTVWLIDFDKCDRRPPGWWMSRNLSRLRRSLRKESRSPFGLNWGEQDWTDFLKGYATV